MEPAFKKLFIEIDAAVRIVESSAQWSTKEAAESYLRNLFRFEAKRIAGMMHEDEAATLRN